MRSKAILLLALAALGFGCDPDPGDKGAPTASGEELFELCVQCHGSNAEGDPDVNAPAIAGLQQWYIEAQLKKFKEGIRGRHPEDYAGMQMSPMAMSLQTEGDIKTVAAYVAALPPHDPPPMLGGGDAQRGEALYQPCVACHGPEAAGNQQLNAPSLKHSSDWYMLTQLKHFKNGIRGANPQDTTGAQMVPMTNTLTDVQAMKDVIAYITTLQ